MCELFPFCELVRKERLELSRVTPLEPKSSASTNSATFALVPRTVDYRAARTRAALEMVGRLGLEPRTKRLRVSCSTN